MTAVMQPTNALRRDHRSREDEQISYSSSSSSATDWKAKYYEVADLLAETRNELDDFQHSSKELEEELDRELQRTDAEKERLRVLVIKAEGERDEWKSKHMNLQTSFNTTTTSLQRELDTLRQDYQKLKVHIRDLEMGNDDLERNERAVASSLADVEAKYSKVLEEKILLEHELLGKATLEEQIQRLRDELRDATAEISVLRDQLKAAQENASRPRQSSESSSLKLVSLAVPSDNLLATPPAELRLTDLGNPSADSESSSDNTPISTPTAASRPSKGQTALLNRAGFPGKTSPSQLTPPGTISGGLSRSSTLPSLSAAPHRTTLPQRNPIPNLVPPNRPAFPSKGSTTSTINIANKSRGVQMVSEMRARVRNLELKIHTRVPRLRMGSMTRSLAPNTLKSPVQQVGDELGRRSASPAKGRPSIEELRRRSADRSSRGSVESRDRKGAESPGWVLIMEETPVKASANGQADTRDRRRRSSPVVAPSAFKPLFSSEIAVQEGETNEPSPLASRPSSRLSASTFSGPSGRVHNLSRPETPTFLPVPSRSYQADLQKPLPSAPSGRRSSLGLSTNALRKSTAGPRKSDEGTSSRRQSGELLAPAQSRRRSGEGTVTASSRRRSGGDPSRGPRSSLGPTLPSIESNKTLSAHGGEVDDRPPSRTHAKSMTASSANGLDKSRIGRPSANSKHLGVSNLRSNGELKREKSRSRSRSGSDVTGSRREF